MSQIKTYTASTLEPCLSSYGLAPTSLTATTVDGGIVTIPIADRPPHNSSTELHTAKDATASTLYLLDRFAVSDQFYHELAQVCTLQFCTCICILTFYVYIWIS